MPALTTAERLEFVKLGFVTEIESYIEEMEKAAGVGGWLKSLLKSSPEIAGAGSGALAGAGIAGGLTGGIGAPVGALIGGGVGALGGLVGRAFGRARSGGALLPHAMELMKTNPGRYATLTDAMADVSKAMPEMAARSVGNPLGRAAAGTAALGAGTLGLGAYGGYELGKGGLETIRDTVSGGRTKGQDMGIGDILKALAMGGAGYYGAGALGNMAGLPPEVQQYLPWIGLLGGGTLGLGGM